MIVIGKKDSDTYLCEVSHREIEKLLNLYYGKREYLKVGEEIDLGAGHDFLGDTREEGE